MQNTQILMEKGILIVFKSLVSEFNEFEPRLKTAKNWFQLSAGLNLEAKNRILSITNHI